MKQLITSLFFLISTSFIAQDYLAYSNNKQNEIKSFNKESQHHSKNEIINLLDNKSFTYKYNKKEVLVIFNGENHVEYYNNKKHYIKSKVVWTSSKTCKMILVESNLPRFPFKPGTPLDFKILKIKKGYIYYESTLGGRSWQGRMKKNNFS